MKSLIAASTAAVALLAVAGTASAQEGVSYYGNVGYSFVDANDADVTLGALGAKLGARFNPYLGVEAEAAFGVDDDSVTTFGVPVKVELKHTVAAYVIGFVPVSPNADLFARIGYGNSEIEASAGGVSAKADGSGVNIGVGGQYFFTGNDGVRVEYLKNSIDGDEGLEANIWSLSYVRKF